MTYMLLISPVWGYPYFTRGPATPASLAVTQASANPGSGLVVIPPSWSTWLLSPDLEGSQNFIPA